MSDQSRLEIVIDSRSAENNVRNVREELSQMEQASAGAIRGTDAFASSLSDADRAAGRYYDSAGKLREANGRFVAGAQQATAGADSLNRSTQSAAVSMHGLRSAALLASSVLATIGVTTGIRSSIQQIGEFQAAMKIGRASCRERV